MSKFSNKFTRSQRSALSFFVMIAVAGYISLFLINKAIDAVDGLDKLSETPNSQLLRELEKDLSGAVGGEEMHTYSSSVVYVTFSYPVQWKLEEIPKKRKIVFRDPLFQQKKFVNDIASMEFLEDMTRDEAIQKTFFVEKKGLYFVINRFGQKGNPAVDYERNGNNILIGDSVVAIYTLTGEYVGTLLNYRVLVSRDNRHAIINVLGSREILDKIIFSFLFIN